MDTVDVASLTSSDRLGTVGLDSLSALRLISLLRRRGVAMTLHELFYHPLGHLEAVYHRGGLAAASGDVDWTSECTLPSDILHSLAAQQDVSTRVEPASSSRPLTVFLTGATGFLGPCLVASLLRALSAYTVVALVRAPTLAVGRTRIEEDMRKAGEWEDAFAGRIVAVLGSLERARFAVARGFGACVVLVPSLLHFSMP